MKSALLLSGGMDSICLAYWLRPELAITVNYGQRCARGEARASSAVARELGISHLTVNADLAHLGSGDLAGRPPNPDAPASDWWPFRNQLLITLAAIGLAGLGFERLLIGTVRTDAQHADGRAEFIQAVSSLLALQEGNLRVEAPAIGLTTAELIREVGIPTELLSWSHSCHRAEFACGTCRGCAKHFRVLEELGLEPY